MSSESENTVEDYVDPLNIKLEMSLSEESEKPETSLTSYTIIPVDYLISTLTDGSFHCKFCTLIYTNKKKGNAIRHCERKHFGDLSSLLHQFSGSNSSRKRKREGEKKGSRISCKFRDREDYVTNALKITVETLSPFSIWDNPEMRRLTGHFDHLFCELTGQLVKENIPIYTEKLRAKISQILEGEFFALKIVVGFPPHQKYDFDDEAAFVLGISVPVIIGAQLQLIHVGICYINHTSYRIFEMIIEDVLRRFGLSIDQVIAITTDNEEHLLRTHRKRHLNEADSISLDECVRKVKEIFPTRQIPCVTPNLDGILKMSLIHSNIPLNCLSTFNSSEEETSDEQLTPVWKELSTLTGKMNSQSYFVGDFIRDFSVFEVKLQLMADEENTLAKRLLPTLKKEKKTMTSSPSFMAAIYMDPRYNRFSEEDKRQSYMSEIDRSVALNYLVKIHKQIKELRDPECETKESATEDPLSIQSHEPISSPKISITNLEETVERMLGLPEEDSVGPPEPRNQNPEFSSKLSQFYKLNSGIKGKANPLEHLQFLGEQHEDVRDLALTILATTSVQVSLPSLSEFWQIVDMKEIGDELQEDIWMLKMNSHLTDL